LLDATKWTAGACTQVAPVQLAILPTHLPTERGISQSHMIRRHILMLHQGAHIRLERR